MSFAMPIIQGVSSVFGALTDESGYKKVSNYDKGQRQMHKQRGDLLQQGAGFLQALSKTLSQSGGPSTNGNGTGLAPTVVTNGGTGRPELRIPLPDEQVLRQWVALAGDAIGALLGRQPATTPDTER